MCVCVCVCVCVQQLPIYEEVLNADVPAKHVSSPLEIRIPIVRQFVNTDDHPDISMSALRTPSYSAQLTCSCEPLVHTHRLDIDKVKLKDHWHRQFTICPFDEADQEERPSRRRAAHKRRCSCPVPTGVGANCLRRCAAALRAVMALQFKFTSLLDSLNCQFSTALFIQPKFSNES